MKLWKIGSLGLILGFTAAPLFAQEGQKQPGGQRLLERFDKDGDGQLSDEELATARETLEGRPSQPRPRDGQPAPEGQPAPGEAQPGRPGRPGPGGPGFFNPEQLFEQLDQNKDGKLSKDELGERGQRFAQADADSDGEITKEELQTARARLREQAARAFDPEQIFARMDQNGDGKLTKEELGERGQWLAPSDANSDGEITLKEVKAGAERRRGQASGGLNPEQLFGRMDQNTDGKLTKEELGERGQWLLQSDANSDGEITKEEYQAALARIRGQAARAFNPEQMFARMDQNGDGKLQKDELRGPRGERFDELDGDKDGAISKEEFQAAGPLRGLLGGAPGGLGRPLSVEETFAQFDKDGDGKLAREELPERMAEFILRADTSGDGAVTKEELQAIRDRAGQSRGDRPRGERNRPAPEENN
jgi:Ca2+-binding EF-hand superfamily protein